MPLHLTFNNPKKIQTFHTSVRGTKAFFPSLRVKLESLVVLVSVGLLDLR